MGKRKAKPTARYLAWYGLLEEQNVCRDIDKEQHSTRRDPAVSMLTDTEDVTSLFQVFYPDTQF